MKEEKGIIDKPFEYMILNAVMDIIFTNYYYLNQKAKKTNKTYQRSIIVVIETVQCIQVTQGNKCV